MLDSLHERAPHLPRVELETPGADPYPKTSRQAMLAGVVVGIRGMVRSIAERFAEEYGAYPRILATGGDAALLFTEDDLVERIVSDLTLRGVALSSFAAIGVDRGEDSSHETNGHRGAGA